LFVGEDDTWEAWLGVDGSGVISRMFSAGHPTTRLRRGFKDEGAPQGQEEMKQRKEENEDDRKAQASGGRTLGSKPLGYNIGCSYLGMNVVSI
jgi:hypothetical protein